MINAAELTLNCEQYLDKFNIPVYENREKAIMNLVRSEIVAKNRNYGTYTTNKRPKTVKTAAQFSSLIKRKEKNEYQCKELLIDVAAEKAKEVANLMRAKILNYDGKNCSEA